MSVPYKIFSRVEVTISNRWSSLNPKTHLESNLCTTIRFKLFFSIRFLYVLEFL